MEAEYKAKGLPVPYNASDKIDREFAAKIGRAPFNSLIDHFDHVIKIAGIDHVGIGTDFDGIPVPPDGIDSAADLPKVTAALMARGYTAEDMRKLLGGNLLRVFREVQADADNSNRPYLSARISILRICGVSENSVAAFAINALAISPFKCASRPASSLNVSNTL